MRIRRRRPAPGAPGDGSATGCRAPWVAVRLAPNGDVQACCANEEHPIGNIAESSLRDIWEGPKAADLRRALDQGDYSLGCELCGDLAVKGLRAASLAADYDKVPLPVDRAWPSQIEFALSITCNLQCVQCTGEFSSSIRAQREHRAPLESPYGDAFFEELRAFVPHLTFASFIGGEPFLMREARRVWDLMLELGAEPDVWVTTNGTHWDDRVEYYLDALKMGVSLSIDGVEPDTIAAIRVGADPAQLIENRDRFLAATRRNGSGFKLNYCVMPQNWQEYLPFLLEADRLGVPVFTARVFSPPEQSLYHLPPAELREVVQAMAAQGATWADRLGPTRSSWDTTLAELTDHLARAEAEESAGHAAGRSVDGATGVDWPRRKVTAPEGRFDQVFRELTTAAGERPMHLEVVAGHVTRVQSPAWADFLGFDRLVGVPVDAILSTVAERLGVQVSPVEDDHEGELRFDAVFRSEGRSVGIHSVMLESDADRLDVLIGLDA